MAIQSGNFGRLLEPGLHKIFFGSYREKMEQYSKIFKVLSSKKSIETDLRMGGFSTFTKKDSMGSVNYMDPTGTESIQYIHEEYSGGFIIERKLYEDEMYNTIGNFSKELGRSARVSVELLAAQVINNGWGGTTAGINGYDGKPLFSNSHPRLDNGPTVANVVTGPLTDQNLKLALTLAREQVNERGLLIQMDPKWLVVPPELEYVARTIVESSNLSPNGNGTLASNVSNAATDKNVIQGGLRVMVWDYMQTLDANNNPVGRGGPNSPWFIMDPTVSNLNFFWRRRLEFKNTEDFDTEQAKYKATYRCSTGYSDFRGVVGSPGH